jgi:transcriptional regulator with XRE-family HTH domain
MTMAERRKKKVAKKKVVQSTTGRPKKKRKKRRDTTVDTVDRTAQMNAMREEGYTFEAIAEEFGVTRQRAWQVVVGSAPVENKEEEGNNHSPNPELLRGRGVQAKIKQYHAVEENASETDIGDRIVFSRMRRGLTLGQLSEESEVPYGVLSTYENNKAQPSCDSLRKLCTALKVSAHWLLFGEPDAESGSLQAEVESLQADVRKWKQRAIRLRKELAS